MYMLSGVANGYYSYYDTYPYTVVRGDYSPQGMRWQPVFQSPTLPEDAIPRANLVNRGTPPQAYASVSSRGQVWLPDIPPSNSGDTVPLNVAGGAGQTRLFTAGPDGHSWSESDTGLIAQDPTTSTAQVIWAPFDPAVGYLVRKGSQDLHRGPMLNVTTDAGRTWTAHVMPAFENASDSNGTSATSASGTGSFGVDPTDARHIFLVSAPADAWYSTDAPGVLTTWESKDLGATWTPHAGSGALPLTPRPISLVVAANARGSADLFYLDRPTGLWFASRDSGSTWKPVPLPATPPQGTWESFTFLAADPAHPGTLVWVSGEPTPVSYSSNGSAITQQEVVSVNIAATTDGFTTAPSGQLTLTTGGDGIFGYGLQSDASGDFFLALQDQNQDPRITSPPSPAARILAFRPSAVRSGGTVTLSGAQRPVVPPPFKAAPPLHPASAVSTCQYTAGEGGSIAFDGAYLDYTNDAHSPGVVYRVDASCRPAAPIVLQAADFPNGVLPVLTSLTYDSRYPLGGGRTGALLAGALSGNDPRVDARRSPIYAIDPTRGRATLASFAPSGADCSSGGQWCEDVSFFSYDVLDDRLLSQVGQQYRGVGWLYPDGSETDDHCIASQDSAGRYVYPFGNAPAAAVAGGKDVVYVLSEDDQTIVRLDLTTCTITGGFTLPGGRTENPSEDEQLACDPLSFNTPVIWIRNSVSGASEAYPVPDAYCPFPTRLTYAGPAAATRGAPAQLCFDLSANRNGQSIMLPGEPVRVDLGGSTVGQAMTDQAGRACVAATPALTGLVPVTGTFAGTMAYLPSSAEGILAIPASTSLPAVLGLLPPALTGGLPPPQPASGAQPTTATGTEPVGSASTQVEVQAQAQTQAQSQAQAQGVAQVQPGVMTQRQKRTQVAIQQQGIDTNTAYEARALRRGRPAPATAVPIALLLLGLGLAARRPRWAGAPSLRMRRGS